MVRKNKESQHDVRRDGNVTPDGHIYRGEGGQWCYVCAACLGASERPVASRDGARSLLTTHLWSVHCWRRVYISTERPEIAGGTQMALPLLVGHDSTRHDDRTV